MKLKHPNADGVYVDVDADRVDEWLAQGWLKDSDEPAKPAGSSVKTTMRKKA